MTGNKDFFKKLIIKDGRWVTFGDGFKKKVIGKGKSCIPRLPNLKNTLLVDKLQANLISITYFCEIFHEVGFNKEGCTILDRKGRIVLKGKRYLDNCYLEIDILKCNVTMECNKFEL